MRFQFRSGKRQWLQTRTTPKATPPTHGLSARQLSIWHVAWDRPAALQLLLDGNDLTETELLELVEYGQLRVVGPEWLTEVPEDDETSDDADSPGPDSDGVQDAEGDGTGDGGDDPDGDGPADDAHDSWGDSSEGGDLC